MSTTPYILEGRAVSDEDVEDYDVPPSPCIFCGKTISHFNDGGPGWLIGAIVDGEPENYLVCEQPVCDERAITQAQCTPLTPECDRVVWRCSCGGSGYVENVGDACHNCRRPPATTPWSDD